MVNKSLKYLSLVAFLAILLSTIIISSCQKEELEVSPDITPNYIENEANLALQELTDIFLDATSSESFRAELKSDALTEYYDDYLLKQSSLKSGETENQIINLLNPHCRVRFIKN